ncbi:uncharacterized protein DS421_16g559840 [Arachis hypogaea]|nr:uncharacterized protein DS421_16g559840 [Arachis hypogaea]
MSKNSEDGKDLKNRTRTMNSNLKKVEERLRKLGLEGRVLPAASKGDDGGGELGDDDGGEELDDDEEGLLHGGWLCDGGSARGGYGVSSESVRVES